MRLCAHFARLILRVEVQRPGFESVSHAQLIVGQWSSDSLTNWQGVCVGSAMNVGEYLDDLCSLDRVAFELRRAGLTRVRRQELEKQVAAIRGRLPTALLTHHDRQTRAGNATIAAIHNQTCGGCHLKLPVGMLADISLPGRIAVCPHCGIFVYKVAKDPEHAHV
jgi:hypothetical protein